MKRITALFLLGSMVLLCAGASPAREQQKEAPDFTLRDLNQQQVELASFRGKKPVVLFFWTTWCPYCLRELKSLNSMTQQLNKDGIELLAINSGESAQKVSRLVKSYGITYPIYLDENSAVTDRYGVYGVPTFFVIDTKGFIRSAGNAFPYAEARKLITEK